MKTDRNTKFPMRLEDAENDHQYIAFYVGFH